MCFSLSFLKGKALIFKVFDIFPCPNFQIIILGAIILYPGKSIFLFIDRDKFEILLIIHLKLKNIQDKNRNCQYFQTYLHCSCPEGKLFYIIL